MLSMSVKKLTLIIVMLICSNTFANLITIVGEKMQISREKTMDNFTLKILELIQANVVTNHITIFPMLDGDTDKIEEKLLSKLWTNNVTSVLLWNPLSQNSFPKKI